MDGAGVLVEELERRGVRQVFGLPGDEVVLLAAMQRSTLDFVVVRHEQAAAFMADAYARVSRRASVCLSTLGPGATNLVTGIANAFLDRSPVIALSGQVGTNQLLKSVHQYVDLEALFRPITKWSATVSDGRSIRDMLAHAFEVATTEREGPVHLSLPADVLADEVPAAAPAERAFSKGDHPAEVGCGADVEVFADLLQRSRAPLAIVGNLPIRVGASAELVDLVEAYQVPVLTTYMGKGAIPEDHPLSLGVVSRHAGRQLDQVFAPADLVIALGFDYVEGVKPALWRVGKAKRTVYVDCAVERDPHLTPSDLRVTGDLRRLLREACLRRSDDLGSCWLDVGRVRAEIQRWINGKTAASNGAIGPPEAIAAIRQVADRSAIVVGDVGLNKYAVGLCFQAREPGTILFSNGLSAMGFSLPGAIGAQLARPDAQVISISGDGGFLMNVQELETAVRRELPVVAIVFRDDRLGLIGRLQEDRFGRRYAVDIGNPDLAMLARSFGAMGFRVTSLSELPGALEAALACRRTAVVDVPICYDHWLR